MFILCQISVNHTLEKNEITHLKTLAKIRTLECSFFNLLIFYERNTIITLDSCVS